MDLGSPQRRAVFARLLVNPGETVTIDRIVDDLWSGDVPDSARNAVHVHLSRLRAALGPDRDRLSRDGSGYRFAIEPHELDASRFADLVDGGCAALDRGDAFGAHAKLSEALDLWRGPVLADLSGESFVHSEAARLEEIRLLALERRAAAGLDLGRHDLIIEELRALVDRHPFRERFWEQLMLALYRARRQAEALQTFEEARTRLIEELGIDPGPDLRRLDEQILSQDPRLDLEDSRRGGCTILNLSHFHTSFVGRERELEVGRQLLADSRLLTLTGPPGSGKTRVATRLAAESADEFPHGTFFIPLARRPAAGHATTAVAPARKLNRTSRTGLSPLGVGE